MRTLLILSLFLSATTSQAMLHFAKKKFTVQGRLEKDPKSGSKLYGLVVNRGQSLEAKFIFKEIPETMLAHVGENIELEVQVQKKTFSGFADATVVGFKRTLDPFESVKSYGYKAFSK